MPNKQQLDKAAWDWATSVEPTSISLDNIEAAYRLKLKRCKPGCRRNCRGNPFCLNNLGEKAWMQDIADDEWHEVDDQNSERRIPNTFVGLKNLGATCYVNSFLQVWFHNPTFRRAIYSWKPQEDPQEKDYFTEDGSFKPVSFIGHLQMLFVQLQFSSRRYIDPSSFINVLGLNATMQQDAQEFRQLFISLLEKKLSHQHNAFVRSIINTQYCGECTYVTRCHSCSTESTRSSRFYDLDLNIKGHKELSECLDEFLQEERLDGPNQYWCSVCQSKQNATRFIRLVHLPPVLHLQLLRFYFERLSSCKKKLNSFIRFPEVLDMSKYMNRPNSIPENTLVYELSGVLIHRGPSAYSGHYIAHIKDRMTGTWFKFNDETVEKMEGKKLQLGTEETLDLPVDESATSKPAVKVPKVTKGHHSSNNAYMLVYKLRNALNTEEEVPDSAILKWDVPGYLQQAVLEDNSSFEEWVKELDDQRAQNVATSKAKQSEIRSLFEKLPSVEEEEFEWVPTTWLTRWLSSDPGTVPEVDLSPYLCPHNKLNPDAAGKLKCISTETANEVFQKYGGGPRLRDSLCRKCVETRCQIFKVKSKVVEDNKIISALLKVKLPEDAEGAFWIGKLSLRTWKRQVLNQYEDTQQYSSNTEEGENDEISHSGISTTESSDIAIMDDQGEEPTVLFNEDLLCEHKSMIFDENQRRLIPSDAWFLLKQYFPDAPEFPRSETPCMLCQAQINEDRQTKDVHKLVAQEQKTSLQDLYLDKNRPNLSKLESGTVLYAISQNFVDEWRKFIKDSSRRAPILQVNNFGLMCSHGKLDQLLNVTPETELTNVVLVWPHEWTLINQIFIVDQEIAVTCTRDPRNLLSLNSQPEVCESCSLSRLQAEERQRLEYSSAKIFVRRVTKADDALLVLQQSETGAPANTVESEDEEDQSQKIKKRRLAEEAAAASLNATPVTPLVPTATPDRPPAEDGSTTPATGTPAVPVGGSGSGESATPMLGAAAIHPQVQAVRRSNRRRLQRGEKTLTVSSDQTLRDLKLQIMKCFSVAPFDQHLSLNGLPLTDVQASLGSLGVAPGALLLLKVDELGEEVIDMEDYAKASAPETGFKGTELMN